MTHRSAIRKIQGGAGRRQKKPTERYVKQLCFATVSHSEWPGPSG